MNSPLIIIYRAHCRKVKNPAYIRTPSELLSNKKIFMLFNTVASNSDLRRLWKTILKSVFLSFTDSLFLLSGANILLLLMCDGCCKSLYVHESHNVCTIVLIEDVDNNNTKCFACKQ